MLQRCSESTLIQLQHPRPRYTVLVTGDSVDFETLTRVLAITFCELDRPRIRVLETDGSLAHDTKRWASRQGIDSAYIKHADLAKSKLKKAIIINTGTVYSSKTILELCELRIPTLDILIGANTEFVKPMYADALQTASAW